MISGESVPQMKEALTVAANTGTDTPTATSTAASSTVNLDNLVGQEDDQMSPSSPAVSNKLDMNGLNRVNVLFSGCSFVTVDGLTSEKQTTTTSTTSTASIPTAPDGGALAYVLRTGFGSSQGSLLQMIEFSQQTVAGRLYSPYYIQRPSIYAYNIVIIPI